jgi:hypothetical protein
VKVMSRGLTGRRKVLVCPCVSPVTANNNAMAQMALRTIRLPSQPGNPSLSVLA